MSRNHQPELMSGWMDDRLIEGLIGRLREKKTRWIGGQMYGWMDR